MKIRHSALSSPIFVLKGTYSFDVSLGDEVFSIKLELYQNELDEEHFRCLIWHIETVQVRAFLEGGTVECTKFILADWSTNLKKDYSNFTACNIDEALIQISSDIEDYLIRTTNRKS